MSNQKSTPRLAGRAIAAVTALILLAACASAEAHFFVSPLDRTSASPDQPGTGWRAEVFLDIPENSATSLLAAESYVAGKTPDFTFRCAYIDFPSGPSDSLLDAEVADIGAFLGAGITEVSNPAKLSQPLGHFLIRFKGLANIRLEINTLGILGLPILLDFGTQGYGGYRLRVGTTSIYRIQNHVFNDNNPFFSENALVHGLGLFPVQCTYYNRYDPAGAVGHQRVGVELYSFFAGGLPWPAGASFFNPQFGNMTVTPPSAIYQPEDVPALARGDFDADGSITLADFAGAQLCYGDGPLAPECALMDFDNDGGVGAFDVAQLVALSAGPGVHPVLPGDYDADNRIDLADYRWLQWCYQLGGDDDRGGLKVGCEAFDFDDSATVDEHDYGTFQKLMFGPVGHH